MCLGSASKCAVCGIESSLRCTGCRNISYCGLEHQKKHWKVHKVECKVFEVSDDEISVTSYIQ